VEQVNTERIATLRAGIETLLDDARADRDRLHAENARLQRAVDDLAGFVRRVHAREHLQGFVARQSLQNDARKVLERNGLLRPCDDPSQVPSAMRAEVE
jgi:hypothetical protein